MSDERALTIFGLALASLEESLLLPAVEARDFAGIIQNFEICFEAAWKSAKVKLRAEGIAGAEGPRAVLTAAFENGLIADEELWLAMLRDRNLTTHTYNKLFAEGLVEKIKSSYHPALSLLNETLTR